MDLIEETAKLQFSLGGSAAEPADVVLESPSNQNEKQRGISPRQPSTLRLLRNDDHGKHNRRHHRKEESRSYCRHSQLKHFDRPSRTKAGSRIRRKHKDHVRRQEPRHRRRYKNCSRRQYRPGSRSLKPIPSNWKRFLCLCSLFLHGCFGNYRYNKS